MTPKEQYARAEIERIAKIPLSQRTAEDRHNWDVALHVRDFAVIDREREAADEKIKSEWRKFFNERRAQEKAK